MLSKLHKKESGFTLIELMIVIAIIGILAAIAVPMFLTYRQRAYNTAAKSVVHNLKADNANLNSELGVYGHTEAAAALLSAAEGGMAAADTNAVPALSLAAFGGAAPAAGARLCGSTVATATNPARTLSIGIALGRDMTADVQNVVDANNNSTFHAFTRHFKGDVAYAIDNDVENVICMVSNPAWPSTAGLQATPFAPALPPADDIAGAAGNGAPTANWTRVAE